jgi:hypothetical protein
MKTESSLSHQSKFTLSTFLLATLLLIGACSDDPKPTNEEELITTVRVTLVPQEEGEIVTLEFYDEDGDGSIEPVYSYSPSTGEGTIGLLAANTTYDATIQFLNETESPAENITEEIEEEADEHLVCFTESLTGLTIDYADTEADYLVGGSSRVVGLSTTWTTSAATGQGTVTLALRHQPGTKTGACPGSGDTDVEVTFNVSIQ